MNLLANSVAASDNDDRLTEPQSPAEVGIWIFIFADMCIFAFYFWVFAWEKSLYPEQFIQGQMTLNNYYGAFNTVILLISSYFAARAIHAARALQMEEFNRSIKFTMICGVVFLLIKAVEYTEKFNAGYNVASNAFYRNYFAFTGFHMLHVMIGLTLLAGLLFFIRNTTQAEKNCKSIEGVGLYWHMVDLLWVVLFSLIYLAP